MLNFFFPHVDDIIKMSKNNGTKAKQQQHRAPVRAVLFFSPPLWWRGLLYFM